MTLMSPKRYIAEAEMMLPRRDAPESRLLRIRHEAEDPRTAAMLVERELAAADGKVLSPTSVRLAPSREGLALALGGAAGLLAGAGIVLARARRRRPVRGEADLIRTLGEPLLATRLMQPEAIDSLCRQLLAHWFVPEHPLLPVVSALPGEGRTRLTLEMAHGFAKYERTLVIDADLRAPRVHAELGVKNRRGLADLLAGGEMQFTEVNGNLAALVAGRLRGDPLELLRSEKLHVLLAAATKHFRVILVDTPAAARGPDLEIFAALARGALVVSRRSRADAAPLARLREELERCSARVVSAIVNPR